jgi:hypothetical protein
MAYSKWHTWENRNKIPEVKEPGIYYVAYTENNIAGNSFSFIPEIIYIGMTISKKGVHGRLAQFRHAIVNKGDGVHGGAERVRFRHKDSELFLANVYIAICSFPLTPSKDTADDWRQKGECVKHEYVSFAEYLDLYGELPEFNDQERSKKK